jgi:uncharacterized protein YrrD
MNLKQHANVVTADEQEVGRVERLVMEPRTKEVTHIVVHSAHLFPDDKVVPVRLIESANERRVTLREAVGDPKALPPFQEKLRGGSSGEQWPTATRADPFGPTASGGEAEMKLNIPDEAVVVSAGTRVVSADDKQVGTLEQVLTEPEADRATHFVVSEGLLLKSRKLLPAAWIGNILDDEIHLTVKARAVNDLHEYES